MRHIVLALLLCLGIAPGTGLAQSHYQTLRQFIGYGAGCNPTAGLTPGNQGEIYGINFGCGPAKSGDGTIFRLTPPGQGATKWGFETIWQLHGGEGAEPQGRLLLGQDGALYGTTSTGSTDHVLFGSVFRLAPPVTGGTKWSLTVLHSFSPGNVNHDGGIPDAQLIQDHTGALYGTTTIAGGHQGLGFGTIFKLTPPAPRDSGTWAFDRLASFTAARRDGSSPLGALYMDAQGVLYGTAGFGGVNGDGTIFTVTPPTGSETKWVKRDIIQFAAPDATPAGGLVAGPDGDLYGSTTGIEAKDAGTIYRIIPPEKGSTRWTEQTIYKFHGTDGAQPMGGLTPDGKGGFYGSTFLGGTKNYGTLFHIQPKPGGELPWQLNTLFDFGGTRDNTQNLQPNGDLVLDSTGALLGTTLLDTTYYAGSVFRFTP